MRLIDIDEMIRILIKSALNEEDCTTKHLDIIGVQYIESIINHYARIRARVFGSAEDIVRCENCIHRPVRVWRDEYDEFDVLAPEVDGEEDWRCPCTNEEDPYYSFVPDDDFFCAYGERREDNADAEGKG